jgi:thymidylate kinase
MTPNVFAIEGLDRLGKSTLIEGIRNQLGYFEVIHFSKPQKLNIYEKSAPVHGVPDGRQSAYHYQSEGFRNSMLLANSGARVIFDRWHLGEVVYSPMYRDYSGDYVYEQEIAAGLHRNCNLRLILLTEDFEAASHFVDDGESLGPASKRAEEQARFIEAFTRSNIKDKRIICVTDRATGGFRHRDDILKEAIY